MTTAGASARTRLPATGYRPRALTRSSRNIYNKMPLPNITSVTDPLNLSGNYFTSAVLKLTATNTTRRSTTTLAETAGVGKYSA